MQNMCIMRLMINRHLTSEQLNIIEESVKNILIALGDDPEREGLVDTPSRVARMYDEVFEGMRYTNEEIANMYNRCFEETKTSDLVVVKDINVFSYCEHHIALMYNMSVSVAYIPNGKVIGLSKIARIADMVCKRLQLQERITADIAQILEMILGTSDIMVKVEGEHSCMSARGINKPGTKTISRITKGAFKNDSTLQTVLL